MTPRTLNPDPDPPRDQPALKEHRMSTTSQTLAVPGRRVIFTGYGGTNINYPGIVTAVAADGALRVRLDGRRSSLRIDPAALPAPKRLVFLDEVGPVPELPMGRFIPTARDLDGERLGVPVCAIGEDGETLIFVTDYKARAVRAAEVYLPELDIDAVGADEGMRPAWAVFDWEPEEAEYPWTVRWDATEADDRAVRIHYLAI